ncbi:Uncharacterised protein [Vibrio cholerae]|nr:Uncharacterised protein [Vibrio cholerae]
MIRLIRLSLAQVILGGQLVALLYYCGLFTA